MMGSMSLSEEEETRALLGVGGSDKAPSVSQEVAPQDPPLQAPGPRAPSPHDCENINSHWVCPLPVVLCDSSQS